MLRTLADRGDQRPLLLLYANRSWDDIIFREEIEQLRQRLRSRSSMPWRLRRRLDRRAGFLTREVLDRRLPADRRTLQHFVCGPDLMREVVEKALYRLGIPLSQSTRSGSTWCSRW